jgi:hypothetical protein
MCSSFSLPACSCRRPTVGSALPSSPRTPTSCKCRAEPRRIFRQQSADSIMQRSCGAKISGRTGSRSPSRPTWAAATWRAGMAKPRAAPPDVSWRNGRAGFPALPTWIASPTQPTHAGFRQRALERLTYSLVPSLSDPRGATHRSLAIAPAGGRRSVRSGQAEGPTDSWRAWNFRAPALGPRPQRYADRTAAGPLARTSAPPSGSYRTLPRVRRCLRAEADAATDTRNRGHRKPGDCRRCSR